MKPKDKNKDSGFKPPSPIAKANIKCSPTPDMIVCGIQHRQNGILLEIWF